MKGTTKIFIADQFARKSLAERLNLEYYENMQDWEWEVSDYTRLNDFLNEYCKKETSDSEKMSLMEMILDSLNDLLYSGKQVTFNKYFDLTIKLLIESKDLHKGTLNYWSNSDFLISTKLIKNLD